MRSPLIDQFCAVLGAQAPEVRDAGPKAEQRRALEMVNDALGVLATVCEENGWADGAERVRALPSSLEVRHQRLRELRDQARTTQDPILWVAMSGAVLMIKHADTKPNGFFIEWAKMIAFEAAAIAKYANRRDLGIQMLAKIRQREGT